MAVQGTIGANLADGVIGEIQDSTPSVVDTYIVDDAITQVGYAVTSTAEGKIVAGGAGVFAGIIANPKHYANYNGDLSANSLLKKGTIAEALSKGRILVNVGGAGAIDDPIYFVDATGALGVGTAAAGQTQIVGAKIVKYVVGANGLALIQIW
jgi:hypothetical protein